MKKTLKNYFKKNFVIFNHNLAKYTSFKVGGKADILFSPKDNIETIKILKKISNIEMPITILGGGSNVLIKDKGIRGIVIIISNWKNNIELIKNKKKFKFIKVSSGLNLKKLCSFSIKNNLLGTNFALGIPGTIGGAISMNTKTKSGSIHRILNNITIFKKNGNIKKIEKPFNTSYNKKFFKKKPPIILECEIKLKKGKKTTIKQNAKNIILTKKKNQPVNLNNAGCFFKNPKNISAGELIEKSGLKGKKIGDAVVSQKHANFIININKASASDILKLANIIQKNVYKNFKIILEPEVRILGE